MVTYLYVKQHRITGLKYFGKTTNSNPYNYTGSGLYWSSHLAKHGYDIETLHVWEFTDPAECEKFALEFSRTNDIVSSPLWANIKEENGKDGGFHGYKWYNNGIESCLCTQCPGDGWSQGRIQTVSTRGFHWYNNGKVNVSSLTKPTGIEWQEGMLKKLLPTIENKTHNFFDPAHRKMLLERNQELLRLGPHSSQKEWTCGHCGKRGKGLSNYARWHGDRCRV